MKFNYAPGLLGYGPKGIDGSDGLQGLSIYFTDYDVNLNESDIKTAIENNYVLWSTDAPNTVLPGGRRYVSGDLFINSRGVVYEIDASNNTFSQTLGQLAKVDFFTTNNSRTDSGFERWFNTAIPSVSTGYMIDNLHLATQDLLRYDISVYGISLNNFTRVEGTTDVVSNLYNTFTIYSIGENNQTDDHKAIALVYDPCYNEFKIGNVDNSSNVRNTNLVFDVSVLKYNKPFRFSKDTSTGYVLTNDEINVPFLFDPNFNKRPSSFIAATQNSLVNISWNLSDFSSDSSIKGDLYFYEDVSYNKVYNLTDVSRGTEIILHNVDSSASVSFSQLQPNTLYKYHMIIKKDGWERSSDKLTAFTSSTNYHITVTDPSNNHLYADASGWFTPGNTYLYDVDISVFIPIGKWTASTTYDWITFKNPSDPSGVSGVFDFDVSLSRNPGTSNRTGYITLSATGVPDKIITVDQSIYVTTVSFTADGSLLFSPSLTDQTVSVGIKLYSWARANAGTFSVKYANTNTKSFKNGVPQSISAAQAVSLGSVNVDDTSTSYTISNISSIDKVNVTVTGDEFADGPDCEYISSGNYMEGLGWAQIVSVSKTSGSGIFVIGSNKYFYNKRIHTSCALQKGISSTEPLPPAAP